MNTPKQSTPPTIAEAQAALDAALAAGTDTAAARALLETARAEAVRQEAQAQTAAETAIQERAKAMVDAAERQLMSLIAAIPGISFPACSIAVEPAEALLRATAMADAANRVVAARAAEMDSLQARLAGLAQARAAIVARRAGGEHKPEDGQQLALLDADSEGLRTLIERTRDTSPPVPENTVTRQQRAWDRAVESANRAALECVARQLDNALVQVLRIGGRSIRYQLSGDLASFL